MTECLGNCGTEPVKGYWCPSCAGFLRRNTQLKTEWPELDDLQNMVAELGYSGTGRRLGVSDNAVRKRLKTRLLWKYQAEKIND